MKLNCASCRYYSAKSCHRWPPIGFEDTAAPPHAIFPPVALTDWCGEHAEVAEDEEDGLRDYSAMLEAKRADIAAPNKPKRGRPRRG